MAKGVLLYMVLMAVGAAIFSPELIGAADLPFRRSTETLTMPDVVLVNQNGEKVSFRKLMESEKTVVVDFVYATCTTVCPILSAGFANLQRKLGDGSNRVWLVSITIDPENDTPAIMKEYLSRYQGRAGWDFLTGSRADINKVMASFGAFFPNKMAHQPLNFIRTAEKGKWVKLDGLIGGMDLLNEIEKVRK